MPVDPPQADEFAQYKANAAPVDEYAQYKAAPPTPDTIGVNRGTPPTGTPIKAGQEYYAGAPATPSAHQYATGYQGPNDAPRDSGGFIERMTTQAGRALQNPMNFVPSWKSLFPPLQAMEQAKQEYQAMQNPQPREDPAKTLGNMAPAAITALVTHAADVAGNPMQAAPEVAPRVPIWQKAGTTPTEPGFNWQGSTPEEIQAHVSRMANRQPATRTVGQPADTPEVVRIPVNKTPQPDPENTELFRGKAQDVKAGASEMQIKHLQEQLDIASPDDRLGILKQLRDAQDRAAGVSIQQPQEVPDISKMGRKAAMDAAEKATPTQPPFPGPKTYEVTRGTDPFTHPNAPANWESTHDYSSNVEQYGYHPDSSTISVKYPKGAVYQFKATPQMYENMKSAPSVGGYIHDVLEPAQRTGKGTYIGTVATRGQRVSQALGGQQ